MTRSTPRTARRNKTTGTCMAPSILLRRRKGAKALFRRAIGLGFQGTRLLPHVSVEHFQHEDAKAGPKNRAASVDLPLKLSAGSLCVDRGPGTIMTLIAPNFVLVEAIPFVPGFAAKQYERLGVII